MGQVIALDTSRNASRLPLKSTLEHGQSGQRVYIREADLGMWVVHEEGDSKGVSFRTRRSAFRFAEDQYAPRAQVVVQPRFPAGREKRTGVAGACRSLVQTVAAH